MNRSAEWLHQAQADLTQAELTTGAGFHEWACFSCHRPAELGARPGPLLPRPAAPDHCGRLQSQDALCQARALVDAIRVALAEA
ncbi:MAG: HEPN domain-containing protein [Synechococcus sp.]